VVLGAIFLGLQWKNGGFASDLGGDPDEAAHAVTALMVHDYLWQAPGQSPLDFASRFYEAFPKVALGHYPPGYYLTGAAALSVWCMPNALIILQALMIAALGTAGWLFARRWITGGDAVLAGFAPALVVLHSELIRVGCHVLADLQLVCLVFAALWAWHAYLQRPSWRASMTFGFLAAAAILTKGSALGLAGVPVLTMVLGNRWQDLKRLHWWGSAIPVLFLAGPWMAYSVRFTQEGFVDQSPAAFFVQALQYYSETLPRIYGWPLLVLLMVSCTRLIFDAVKQTTDRTRLVLWAGWLSMQLLVMVIPTGFSPRYALPGLLPGLLLALVEVQFGLTRALASQRSGLPRQALAWGTALVLFLVTLALIPSVRPKTVSGFSTAVQRLLSDSGTGPKGVWLVSSDPRGEGAVIAEAAFRSTHRVSGGLTVHRGSKSLVDTDWLSQNYQPKFTDSRSLLHILDSLRIDTVLVDFSMDPTRVDLHEHALKEALISLDSGWRLAWQQPITRIGASASHGDLWIFKRSPK
jgi:hypothetical protein